MRVGEDDEDLICSSDGLRSYVHIPALGALDFVFCKGCGAGRGGFQTVCPRSPGDVVM